jgi:hypothetical protein
MVKESIARFFLEPRKPHPIDEFNESGLSRFAPQPNPSHGKGINCALLSGTQKTAPN